MKAEGVIGGPFRVSVVVRIHPEPLSRGAAADRSSDPVDAFEVVYRRCRPHLIDLCHRALRGRGDADAVVQESFVRAWSSLDRFGDGRPFWPWVATIARRLCIDSLRRLDRETAGLHLHWAMSQCPEPAPEDVVEADDEYRSARRALATLTPVQQRVLTLHHVRGWSYDEIARHEGVSTESVRGSLKRARASLRSSYEELQTAL